MLQLLPHLPRRVRRQRVPRLLRRPAHERRQLDEGQRDRARPVPARQGGPRARDLRALRLRRLRDPGPDRGHLPARGRHRADRPGEGQGQQGPRGPLPLSPDRVERGAPAGPEVHPVRPSAGQGRSGAPLRRVLPQRRAHLRRPGRSRQRGRRRWWPPAPRSCTPSTRWARRSPTGTCPGSSSPAPSSTATWTRSRPGSTWCSPATAASQTAQDQRLRRLRVRGSGGRRQLHGHDRGPGLRARHADEPGPAGTSTSARSCWGSRARMPGSASYGAYIPLFRLSRAEIARAWGGAARAGRARRRQLRRGQPHHGRGRRAGLPQGRRRRDRRRRCTSPPPRPPTRRSRPRPPSPRSWTCRRTRPPRTSPGSLRCGTNALKAALDAVAAGSAESVLVCAADIRLGYPSGPGEMNFGDGAVALLVGARRHHRRGQALRQPVLRDPGHLALGPGHLRAHGRGPLLHGRGLRGRHGPRACPRPSRSTGWPRPTSRTWRSTPRTRASSRTSRRSCASTSRPRSTTCCTRRSATPAAPPRLLSLVAALEQAAGGETILLACYGNGCDTAVLETTDADRLRAGLPRRAQAHRVQAPAEELRAVPALARAGPDPAGGAPAHRGAHALAVGPVARGRPGDAAHGHQLPALRHAAVPAAARVRLVPHQGRDGAVPVHRRAGEGLLVLARLRDGVRSIRRSR